MERAPTTPVLNRARPHIGTIPDTTGMERRRYQRRRTSLKKTGGRNDRPPSCCHLCLPNGYRRRHHFMAQSPVRLPSTFIVTDRAWSPLGVALRTTEKPVLETVPSTRVIAWTPSMS